MSLTILYLLSTLKDSILNWLELGGWGNDSSLPYLYFQGASLILMNHLLICTIPYAEHVEYPQNTGGCSIQLRDLNICWGYWGDTKV